MAFKATKQSAPSTPATNKAEIYFDTTTRRATQIDDLGVKSVLVNDGLKNRNIITNGGLYIQQRVATAATAIAGISTTTRGGVVSDCFSVSASTATNVAWAQIDSNASPETGLLARYYGSIVKSSAVKKVMISHYILFSDMAHLRGQQVRVSCKTNIKVGNAQTLKLGLIQLSSTGTVDAPPAFLSGAWSGVLGTDPAWNTNTAAITPDAGITPENGTISGAYLEISAQQTTWVRSSCVFTVPSNCKGLYVVLFSNETGGSTDNISVAEFQLTLGQEITDFVQPPLAEELIKCQRRYCKTFALTTVPVTNAGINTGECKAVAGKAGAVANACIFAWRFPVVMWKTPVTVTLYNPGAANALGRNLTGAADLGATALTAQLDSSVMAISTGVAATAVGDQCGIHITADAEIVA